MPHKRRVLFLCTGNACRSQMAEAVLRSLDDEEFEALSAGSHPAGFIHQVAIAAMERMGIPMEGQSSKGWDEYADTELDAVITLCDAAAAEECPTWHGSPITAHWPLPDPAYQMGDDEDRIEFALRVAERLRSKIAGLVELDWSLPSEKLREQIDFLGEI